MRGKAAMPKGFDIASLPGPRRGEWPALYFRDETVASPTGNRFALAYSICEASMCNEVGCVAWGSVHDGIGKIEGNPEGLIATCWFTPWCSWIGDTAFVFKAQRYAGGRLYMPLVVVDCLQGFAVVPGSDNSDSRPTSVVSLPAQLQPIGDGALLLAAIEGGA